MAILKRQLEEKEKLLATEQEDAAAAKSKLRELNKVGPAPGRPGGCGLREDPCAAGSLSGLGMHGLEGTVGPAVVAPSF